MQLKTIRGSFLAKILALFIITLSLSSQGYCAQINGALNFNGTNNYVTAGTTLGNFGTSDFTIECYLKTTSTSGGYIVSKRSVCGHESYFEFGINSGGYLTADVDQDASGTNANSLTSTSPVNNGNWHHVALVRSGATLKLFVDGVASGSATGAGIANISNTDALTIGNIGSNCTNGLFLNFTLDELRIYNTALTQCTIRSTLNTSLVGNETGLVAYYNFNQFPANANNALMVNLSNMATTGSTFNGTLFNFALSGTSSNWVTGYTAIPTPSAAPSTATLTQSAVGSYAWHGTTYTTSGSYTFDTLNSVGCDSLTTLNLTITAPPTPVIYSFNPPGNCSGNSTTVTIFGSGFTGATEVGLGGRGDYTPMALPFTVVNDNTITTTIPANSIGGIYVETPDGIAWGGVFINSKSYASFAYISNANTNTVSVINTTSNTVVKTIPVGNTPQGVCVSPDGTRAYVANAQSGNVSVINTATNTVIGTLTTGVAPSAITISKDGTTLYVANYYSFNISVIDIASNTIITNLLVNGHPYAINISPDGSKVFVSGAGGGNGLVVINTANNTIQSTINSVVENNVAFSADGSILYVANQQEGTVSLYNIKDTGYAYSGNVSVGSNPVAIAISPDGSTAYVTNNKSNTVSVVNTVIGTVIKIITVGTFPGGISISPDGLKVYVVNNGSNNVSVISTATNTVTSTFAVGNAPIGGINFIANVPTCCPTTATITQTATDSYSWHGTTYTKSGTYTFDTLNAGGCDSLITLNLTVNHSPVIYSFNPPGNCPGKATTVTIFGSGFTGATNVSMVGKYPMFPFTVNSDNSITTTIPANDTGVIFVQTPVNIAFAPTSFTNNSNYTPFAYVVNSQSNNVGVLNIVTNAIVATIPVGKNPVSTCFSPDGTRVYVTNSGSNNVSVINTATNTVIDSVTVGRNPQDASITPDGKKIYVGNSNSNDVTIINTANNSVIKTIPIGSYYDGPTAVSISPDGSKVYVANYGDALSVINTATDIISTTTITSDHYNFMEVKFSPDGKKAFAADDSVYTINTATNSVINSIWTGSSAAYLQPNIDGTKLYVSKYGNNSSLTVINTINNTIIKNIPLGNIPNGLSLTPDGSKLYVETNGNSVYVINTASDSVINTISGFNYRYNNGNFIGNVQVPCCEPTTATITQSACGNYKWHGITYTTSGSYTFDSLNKGGCDSLTTLNLTITSAITPSVSITANPAGSITSGTSVTFTATPTNGGAVPSYQWKKNGTNVGTNSSAYTDAALVNNDVITCVLTANNTCQTTATANSNSITETVTSSQPNYVWTGTTSTDWGVATNWSNTILPTAAVTVTIPSAPVNQPSLSSDISVTGIVLNGALAINGHSLTITGAVSGTGKLKGSATSSLVMNSSSNNTINFGTTATDSLLSSLTLSGNGTVTLGSGLGLKTLLSVNNGSLATGNHLTLKSTSLANTAVVGPVSGTITGNVTVERYIPQGVKAYRSLITGGVYNAGSIFNNWQEGGVNNNGYGIFITGKVGQVAGLDASTGFDISPAGYKSMYNYTNYLTYSPVTNTKSTNLDPYTAYLTVVYGNRALPLIPASVFDASSNMNAAATIRTTGSLVTGNVTFSNTGVTGNYNSTVTKLLPLKDTGSFIANPYACAIDWESLSRTNLTSSYYYYEPTYLNGGYQSFVSYNGVSHTNSNPTRSKINRYIQPGQGFWIQTNSTVTTNRQLAITESNKVTGQPFTAVFGTGTVNRLAMSLWKQGQNIDGAVAIFDNNYTTSYGDEDSRKMFNSGENLFINDGVNPLSIDGIPNPVVNDRIVLQMSGLKKDSAYQFHLDAQELNCNGLTAYLIDNLKSTETLIGANSTEYSFAATAANENRFALVFRQGTLPVHFVTVKAKAASQKSNVISWSVADAIGMSHYEVEQSATGKEFTKIASVAANGKSIYSITDNAVTTNTTYYRIKAIDNNGKAIYSNVVIAAPSATAGRIVVTPNPVRGNTIGLQINNLEKGIYVARLYNAIGQVVLTKEIAVDGNATIEMPISNTLTNGMYSLTLKGANNYTSEVILNR